MSTGRHAIEEKLAEIATPEIYRRNAFRILGLKTDASPSDIRRSGKKLETALKVGTEIKVSRVPPYSAEITVDEVTAAIHVLQDPINRIVHELFWFWPMEAEGSDDRAILLLEQGDPNGAIAIWKEAITTKGKRSKATHNLAILYHMWALWFEGLHQRSQLPQEDISKKQNYWATAYQYWNQSVSFPGFRVQIEKRIAEIGDPRLTDEIGETLDDATVNVVVRVGVQLTVALATSGHADVAREAYQLIRESPFDGELLHDVVNDCILPAADSVRSECEHVKAELVGNPKLGPALADRLVSATSIQIAILRIFHNEDEGAEDDEECENEDSDDIFAGLEDDDENGAATGNANSSSKLSLVSNQINDLIADTIEECAARFAQATQEWRDVMPILQRALVHARSPLIISRIEKGIEAVQSNIDDLDNERASQLVGQANEATQNGDYSKAAELLKRAWEICKDETYKQQIYGWWQSAKIQPSVGNAYPKAQIPTHARTNNWQKSLPYLIIIAIIVFIVATKQGCEEDAPRQNTSREPSGSAMNQTPRRESVSSGSAIELERSELRGMESEIAGMDSVLGIMENKLQSYRAQVNTFEWQIANGLDVNEQAYDAALKRHNELVKRHNALVADRNSKYSLYDAKVNSFNERVRQYNAGARR